MRTTDTIALFDALPQTSLDALTGSENVLVLVARPGDEACFCGGLIAQSCRRGRPPFVMLLGDGTSSDPAADPARLAARHAVETAAAAEALGLPRDRLLLAGIVDRFLSGPALFDPAVRAVVAVMWRQDCNLVLAPAPGSADPGEHAAARMAEAVAARSSVARLCYPGRAWRPAPAEGWRLDIAPDLPAKRRAVAAHAALPPGTVTGVEAYVRTRVMEPHSPG